MAKVRKALTVASRRPPRVREERVAPVSVLIDANVVFDLFLSRAPWYAEAVTLVEAINAGRLSACIAAHTVTTLWYVCRKAFGSERARAVVAHALSAFSVATLDADDLRRAITLPFDDFEDACQMLAAERAGASAIVTRDARHFRDSPIPIVSPAHLIAQLNS